MAFETTAEGLDTLVGSQALAASRAIGLGVHIGGSRKGVRVGVEGYTESDAGDKKG